MKGGKKYSRKSLGQRPNQRHVLRFMKRENNTEKMKITHEQKLVILEADCVFKKQRRVFS